MLTQGALIVTDKDKLGILVSHGLPADQSLNFAVGENSFRLLVGSNIVWEIHDIEDHYYKHIKNLDECQVFEMQNGMLPNNGHYKTAYRV